jgi:hypothetical protein
MCPTVPDLTFDIEQNGHSWIVGGDGTTGTAPIP